MNYLLTTLTALLAAEEVSIVTGLIIPSIVVLILVLINGFFVAAEFAMLGSRPSRMETMAEQGNKKAGIIQNLLESVSRQNSYLATAQLGITIVTLALSMYGEKSIAHWFEEAILHNQFHIESESLRVTIGTIVVLTVLTFLHVVIGEMVPKAIALGNPNSVVISLFRPMNILERILYIPIKILNGIGNALLRVIGIAPEHEKARLYSSEEIEQIVSESTEEGLITEESETLISNIFDFSERDVGQVMTPRRTISAIPIDIGYDELLTMLTESNHSRFPVYEDDLDHIVGILHLKDFAWQHLNRDAETTPFDLRAILREKTEVLANMSADELLQDFKLQHYHIAVVIDEFGGVDGLVTLEDLVEEIVGEVRDEFDVEREPFVEVSSGVIECAGDYLMADLTQKVFIGDESSLPDVDTVGGLVVAHLGRPPILKDEIAIGDVKFTVEGIDGRAITRLRVVYPAFVPDEDADAH